MSTGATLQARHFSLSVCTGWTFFVVNNGRWKVVSWEMRFLYNVHCIVHVLISTVNIGTEYKVLVGYNTYLLSTYVLQ